MLANLLVSLVAAASAPMFGRVAPPAINAPSLMDIVDPPCPWNRRHGNRSVTAASLKSAKRRRANLRKHPRCRNGRKVAK